MSQLGAIVGRGGTRVPDPCPGPLSHFSISGMTKSSYCSLGRVPRLAVTTSKTRAMPRTTNPYELALRSRLGKAAVIGGLRRVEQEAAKALPVVLAAGLDAETVSAMLKTFRRISDRCERSPPPSRVPSPNERVKVRWTDELIARFKREARWCKDNRLLARKLGLPEFCEGAMRAARSRYGVAATRQRRQICAPVGVLREAA